MLAPTGTIQQTFRTHEQEKRRAYETRIRQVDGGSFTPLVFTTAGGAGPAASVFLKHLGSKIAKKKDAPYSQTIGWLRCRLSFALLRASILCIRGSTFAEAGWLTFLPAWPCCGRRPHHGHLSFKWLPNSCKFLLQIQTQSFLQYICFVFVYGFCPFFCVHIDDFPSAWPSYPLLMMHFALYYLSFFYVLFCS